MKDVADALSFFSTDNGTLNFFALLFPGFIAVAVYDLRVPGERRKWSDMGIALVAYSVLIDVIAAVYLKLAPLNINDVWRGIGVALAADLVGPALLGWFIVDVREIAAAKGWVLSAIPKAWDVFFHRIQSEPVALVVTLKDGQRVGGFWADDPFASSYPADEDLLIPAPVTIGDNGLFLKRIRFAKGLLIKRDDILMIEAFDADEMAEASNLHRLALKKSATTRNTGTTVGEKKDT